MVWSLAAEGHSGPGPFYFTAPGTYTVGRKDCTITIQTDKTISRLHAEISVEAAPLQKSAQKNDDNVPRCKFSVKDLSKFGTFVNKDPGSKPLNSLPDSTAVLKEGDVITFGTNKAVFRLQHFPMVFCMTPSAYQSNKDMRSSAESLGALVFEQWDSKCTHLVVEEGSLVMDLVIAAVMSKKPVVSVEWLKALILEPSPSFQLPNLSRYIPTLKMKSNGLTVPAPIVEPLAREKAFGAYTVFMEARVRYHNRDLPSLVKAAGGALKIFTSDDLKDVAASVQQNGLLVFPEGQSSRKDWLGSRVLPFIQHLCPISEEDLVRGILTSKFELTPGSVSPVLSAASVDTDETVDAEECQGDGEVTSLVLEVVQAGESLQAPPGEVVIDSKMECVTGEKPSVSSRAVSVLQSQLAEPLKVVENSLQNNATWQGSSSKELVKSHAVFETIGKRPDNLTDAEIQRSPVLKRELDLALSDEFKPEVIFDSGLVVQKNWDTSRAESLGGEVPNFKLFKKGVAIYGNNFSSLVPFAKDPYRESDFGKEMGDYVKEEKKRKEAESLAEDLFNTDQLKRRRVTASDAGKSGASTSRSRKVS